MHIVLLSTYGFDPHFPSRPEFVLARTLAEMGHTVSAIEYWHNQQQPQTQQFQANLTIYRCRTFGFFSRDLASLSTKLPPIDIIHVHHLRHLMAYQAQFHWRGQIPMCLTPHGMLHDGDLVVDRERPLEHPLTPEKLVFRKREVVRRLVTFHHIRRTLRNYLIHAPLLRYDGHLALSHHERGVLIDLGVAADTVEVVANSVDVSQYLAMRGSVKSARPTILFIGQLIPRKGWDLTIETVALLKSQIPDIRLQMITHNTSEMAALNMRIEQHALHDHVEIYTRVDEAQKVAMLSQAHVLLAPSRYEGFGIPPIEAMAADCPVVTTDCAAGNEVVQHEHTGLLVAYDDVAGFAQAIRRILTDADLRERLITNGRAHVSHAYHPTHIATETLNAYARIMARA